MSAADLLACMPYLHGDVIDDELEAACSYEYARESKTLLWSARLHRKCPSAGSEEIAARTERRFKGGCWFLNDPWSFIAECPSFPQKSWNLLSDKERSDILLVFPTAKVQPLRMNEVWNLDANGVFDEFKAMAAKQAQDKVKFGSRPAKKIYPIIEGWPKQNREGSRWVHALFNLDFTKTKARLLEEFDEWLKLPENEARFTVHKQDPTGKTGSFRDRLKDLASWRLSRALGWASAHAFTIKHRLKVKDGAGSARAFLDARTGQSEKVALNDAPLYGHESHWSKAKARAEDHLAKLLPWEFGVYADERKQWEVECREGFQKISKGSS